MKPFQNNLIVRQPLTHSPNFDQIWAWFAGSTTVTPGSARAYKQGVQALRQWCQEHGIGMRELVPDDLIRFRKELQEGDLAPSTVNIRLTGIRQFLLWLEQEGWGSERLSEDRIRRYLQSPKVPEKEAPFLSVDEINAFMLATTESENADRDYQLFVTMFNSGLRLAEVLNLHLGDLELVDDGEGILLVRRGKGGNPRRFRVPPIVVEMIEHRRRDLKLRWQNKQDREQRLFEMSPGNLRKLVRRTALRARIQKPTSPHTIRHSFAVHCEAPIEILQQVLGHKDLKTTMRYRHAQHLAYGSSYSMRFWESDGN